LLLQKNYIINNLDAIIIAERPKMAPFIEKMRENLARSLKISLEQVNIKATTTEGLGCTGRGEGIAAQAVVSIKEVTNAG
jgi:2-C-methyl-D-erythritol 2,4-cyclodiphosphate synthase